MFGFCLYYLDRVTSRGPRVCKGTQSLPTDIVSIVILNPHRSDRPVPTDGNFSDSMSRVHLPHTVLPVGLPSTSLRRKYHKDDPPCPRHLLRPNPNQAHLQKSPETNRPWTGPHYSHLSPGLPLSDYGSRQPPHPSESRPTKPFVQTPGQPMAEFLTRSGPTPTGRS